MKKPKTRGRPATVQTSGVGAAIRRRRTAKRLTLKALAALLGVRPRRLWDWETGRTRVPAEALAAIAKQLGCAASDLLGR